MNIDILQIPVFEGCDIKGVEQAPKVLIESGAVDIFKKHHNVTLFEEVQFVDLDQSKMLDADKNIKYRDEIRNMTADICNAVYSSISKGNLPISFGGDHSIGTGTIAGNSQAHSGKIAAIWLDAHPDMNTSQSSGSKNFHGMSFGAAMGYVDEGINEIGHKGAKVRFENSYLLGIRDIDRGEKFVIDLQNVFNFKSSEVNAMGASIAADKILADIDKKGMDSIHFSIDVDVITPEDMPSVNVPVSSGIKIDDAIIIIKKIVSHPKVKSIDFVEYNPMIDTDGKSLANCLRILEEISKSLADR